MAVRILIADDHADVRSQLKQLIRNSGHDWEVCCEAADGQEAVEQAVQYKPDLLILDMMMPRRNGFNAGREIHRLLPHSPVILYTLLASEYLEAEAKKAGFFAVVQKSNTAALIAAIHNALAARGFRPGSAMPGESRGPSRS